MFQAFFRRKSYHDGDTVAQGKLLLFLVEELANRPDQSKEPEGRQRRATGQDPDRLACSNLTSRRTRAGWVAYIVQQTICCRAPKEGKERLLVNCVMWMRES